MVLMCANCGVKMQLNWIVCLRHLQHMVILLNSMPLCEVYRESPSCHFSLIDCFLIPIAFDLWCNELHFSPWALVVPMSHPSCEHRSWWWGWWGASWVDFDVRISYWISVLEFKHPPARKAHQVDSYEIPLDSRRVLISKTTARQADLRHRSACDRTIIRLKY